MSVRRWSLLATAVLLALPGAAPAASGAADDPDTWGPVHRFERNPVGESVVVGPGGRTTVAWGSQRGWPEPVKVAQRTAAGRWLAPETLGVGHDPVLAVDAAGNLTVAWCRDRTGFTTGIWVARKLVGQPWTRPVHVSADRAAPGYPDGGSTYGATGLDVATRRAGAAVVTWTWGNWERDIPFRVQAAYRPVHGRWGAVRTLTPPASEASYAQAALARNGTAWVAYDLSPATGPARVEVRSRPAAGGWLPARRLGTGSLGALGIGGRDDVSVLFLRRGRVTFIQRSAAGVWKAPVAVTPRGVRMQHWSAALSPRGAAVVAYLRRDNRVDVVRRAFGGRWTEPLTLNEPGTSLVEVFTAVNPGGDVFVGWDNSYGMWGRYRPARQRWHPVTTAQADHGVDVLESVRTQVAPGGDVVLLWAQEARALRARVLGVR